MSSRSIRANNLSSPNSTLGQQRGRLMSGVKPRVDQSWKVWKRNPAWINNVSITDTDQAAGMLIAVDETATNPIAIYCVGDYEVDWGDGNGFQQYSSSTTQEFNYSWYNSAYDNTNGAVTFTDSTDLVTVNSASGFAFENGDRVNFYSITTTTGVSVGVDYYVINVNSGARTFQLSLTSGGSAISLTNDGSGTLLPYKQALVHVRAQSGANITRADLLIKPTSNVGTSTFQFSPHLEVVASFPNCTSNQNFSLSYPNGGGITWKPARIEHIHLVNCQTPNWSQMFLNMYGLKHIRLDTIGTITGFTQTFGFCRSLIKVQMGASDNPDIELPTSTCTSFNNAFSGCYSLIRAPKLQFDSATLVANIYQNCYVLQEVQPNLWGNSVTSMNYAFRYCYALKKIPPFGFSSTLTALNGVFQGCRSIEIAPMLDTSNCTSLLSMFSDCYSLRVLPNWDVTNVTNFGYCFNSCYSLEEVPESWDMSNCTNCSLIFYDCRSLLKVPSSLDNCLPTTISQCFYQCYSLIRLPEWNTVNCTTFYGAYWGCSSASNPRIELDCSSIATGTTNHFNYVFYNNTCLNEISIKNSANIRYPYQAFYGCITLLKVRFDQAMTFTDSRAMFRNCILLTEIEANVTLSGTSFSNMFDSCYGLQKLPTVDASGITSAQTNFLYRNYSLKNARNFTGMKYATLNLQDAALDADELDELYTNLGTASGQTIIVTNCPGTSSDDPTIATAKGWTVTG